jgi:APA family basic amino acid/polyamine antiporter
MADNREARLLGPWMTLALVIGGVIGSGIFYLPIALPRPPLAPVTSAVIPDKSNILIPCHAELVSASICYTRSALQNGP